MLTVRFCSKFAEQLVKGTRYHQPATKTLLHHRKPQQIILRAFRNSSRQENQNISNFPIQGGGSVPSGNVTKALIFTGAFTAGCFAAATVLEYENARSNLLEKARHPKFAFLRQKTVEINSKWDEIKFELKNYWSRLTPGERVFVPLCALNMIVFGLWRLPSTRNFMLTYFTSNPAARVLCWPMVLSTFSHYSAFHLFANMYVLHSFCNPAVLTLGKEQFLAVYLTGGVMASLASILYKTAIAHAEYSLGASGAIMAILAYVCTQYPETQLSILFLPTLTFSAGSAIKVIMGIDFAGCLLGWRFFDHAAHLGGALFGLFWAYFGAEAWNKRLPFLSFYHDLRKTK